MEKPHNRKKNSKEEKRKRMIRIAALVLVALFLFSSVFALISQASPVSEDADTGGSSWTLVGAKEEEKGEKWHYTREEEPETQPAYAGGITEEDSIEANYAISSSYVKGTIYDDESTASKLYHVGLDTLSEVDSAPLGIQIAAFAMSYVGVTPYVHAGGSLITGTDCSGFTHLIYQHFGIDIPTGSAMYQDYVGRKITYEELMPGDILVYGNGAHVAIYIGNDLIAHCSCPEYGTVCWESGYRNATAFIRLPELDECWGISPQID